MTTLTPNVKKYIFFKILPRYRRVEDHFCCIKFIHFYTYTNNVHTSYTCLLE